MADDIEWSYDGDPFAVGGYRLYAVADKLAIADANDTTPTARRVCPAPTALDVSCVEPLGAIDPALELYYQVVGVCGTGLEGPN